MSNTDEILITPPALDVLESAWRSQWQHALEIWSPYIKLHEPVFCLSAAAENKEGLTGSFAMIRLTDLSVVLSLPQIVKAKLSGFGLEIMAHEIDHHVYCPADLADMGRMLARIRRALPTKENMAAFVSNLYSDLLINDRLFRTHGLPMDEIYKAIIEPEPSPLWNFYMRIYEILWSLPRGTLTSAPVDDEMEADPQLGNQLIRHYAEDWLAGAGRFAALCLSYLLKEFNFKQKQLLTQWMDTMQPGSDEAMPAGLTEIEADEIEGAVHPSLDAKDKPPNNPQGNSGGNYREPFEYGELLKNLGIKLTPEEIAIRYYRERAIPYLIPFPKEILPQSTDPLPEGTETWEVGSPLYKIDWMETILRSPVVIPGFTTVERFYGTSEGAEPATEPVDLDLYVDCSGSMPNPTTNVSYLTLAAAIISISALRAGSRVQATLWSDTKQVITTRGFIRNEKEILTVMTGFFGGGTAFPIHMLRDTYQPLDDHSRKVHILVISDEGVTTMFDKDERGNKGTVIAAQALAKARGGGTFVLNLYGDWRNDKLLVQANTMGWDIYPIQNWEDLLQFSREFTRKHYHKEKKV